VHAHYGGSVRGRSIHIHLSLLPLIEESRVVVLKNRIDRIEREAASLKGKQDQADPERRIMELFAVAKFQNLRFRAARLEGTKFRDLSATEQMRFIDHNDNLIDAAMSEEVLVKFLNAPDRATFMRVLALARSQMTAVVDAINQRYEFVYDPLGHVTENKKGTATMSFLYHPAGNRSQRTDYNGAVTNYSYDSNATRSTAILVVNSS
jgi:YD repeat-containing protein